MAVGMGSGHLYKALAAVVLIAVMVGAAVLFDLQRLVQETLARISGLGNLGPLLFAGFYILACILWFPGSVLTLGAGALFGVVKGFIAVSIGSVLGATCAFLIGRYLVRDLVAGRMAGNEKFQALDEAVGREGWKIVLLTRLSPLFPFNLLNYGFGLTRVSLKHFFFASWLGMVPGTLLYVYIGSLASDLAGLGGAERVRTTGEWALYGIGLLATVAVTVFVTRLARKALSAHISQ